MFHTFHSKAVSHFQIIIIIHSSWVFLKIKAMLDLVRAWQDFFERKSIRTIGYTENLKKNPQEDKVAKGTLYTN